MPVAGLKELQSRAGEGFALIRLDFEPGYDNRQALADGARLAPVLVFPSKEDLGRYGLPGRPYWMALFAELGRRGLPFIDLIEPLLASARSQPGGPSTARLYQGGHLSQAGNAIVARVLLEWIHAHD